MQDYLKCCGTSFPLGKCSRGMKKGCSGVHCKCMEVDCPNMHYIDCFEHYIHVENTEKPMSELEILKADKKELLEALIWCSGSDDFQVGGKARVGWEKLCQPIIQENIEENS